MEEFKKYLKPMELRPITQEHIDEFNDDGGIMYDGEVARYALTIGNARPRIGDMIARDPDNHNRQWLVTEREFSTYKESIEGKVELTKEEANFVIDALTIAFVDADKNLERKNLGDIEKQNLEYRKDKCRELLDKLGF